MKTTIVILIFLLSACAKKGVHFDLSEIDSAIPQYAALQNAENQINDPAFIECMKYELNNVPEAYEPFKKIAIDYILGIYPVGSLSTTYANGEYGGGKISLTWISFQWGKKALVGILMHEIAHSLGFDHPVYDQPGYADSIPERFNSAGRKCTP